MFFWNKRPILNKDAQHRIMAAIKEAEGKTTGEVRVYMEHKCSYMDAMHRAQEIFAKLEMHKTEKRNAVLIYIALKDQQYAIYGDAEIYEKAGGQQFWEKASQLLKGHLKKDQITEGLVACINELGNALATHFPYDPAVSKNQLPDEIVFGK